MAILQGWGIKWWNCKPVQAPIKETGFGGDIVGTAPQFAFVTLTRANGKVLEIRFKAHEIRQLHRMCEEFIARNSLTK